MYKRKLNLLRLRLLSMDITFFLELSELFEKLREARVAGNKDLFKHTTISLAEYTKLELSFARKMVKRISLSKNIDVFTEVSGHRTRRCGFVQSRIAPLKKEEGLRVRDRGWEKKRRVLIQEACKGCGLSETVIDFFLEWLQGESRAIIQKVTAT